MLNADDSRSPSSRGLSWDKRYTQIRPATTDREPHRLVVLGVIVTFALVMIIGSLRSYGQNAVVSDLITSRSNKEFLSERLQSVQDYLKTQTRSGLFLTTTVAQSAGRLLITRTASHTTDSCSGVVIGNSEFLTAAHCVCKISTGNARDAQECLPQLSDLQLSVFLPAFGLFAVKTLPVLHPDYRSPSFIEPSSIGDVSHTAAPLADLVLVQFDGRITSGLPKLHSGSGSYLISSFGVMYFTIEEYARRLGFEVGRPISAGVGQVSRVPNLFRDRRDCGQYHSGDTFCSGPFSPLPVEDGPLQSTTVCQGDSGGPVYQTSSDGEETLVGLVSYFSPPNQFDGCSGDTGRRTHFTDLSRYYGWLSRNAKPESLESNVPSCVDGIFQRGQLDFLGFTGLLTATSFDKTSGGGPRATSIVVSPPASCNNAEAFGVISCRVSSPSYASVDIASDYAQLTICQEQKHAGP